jgi:hypothetical protein
MADNDTQLDQTIPQIDRIVAKCGRLDFRKSLCQVASVPDFEEPQSTGLHRA